MSYSDCFVFCFLMRAICEWVSKFFFLIGECSWLSTPGSTEIKIKCWRVHHPFLILSKTHTDQTLKRNKCAESHNAALVDTSSPFRFWSQNLKPIEEHDEQIWREPLIRILWWTSSVHLGYKTHVYQDWRLWKLSKLFVWNNGCLWSCLISQSWLWLTSEKAVAYLSVSPCKGR